MKNSLRIHKWTHNEFNIFILGVLTHPHHPHTLMDKSCYNRTKNELLIRLDIACKQIEKTVPEE